MYDALATLISIFGLLMATIGMFACIIVIGNL